MKITENEASVILGALDVAKAERGLSKQESDLMRRIIRNFPIIKARLEADALKNRLWAKDVENDKRVMEIRKKITLYLSQKDGYKSEEFQKWLNRLQEVKTIVYNEIAPLHGIPGCGEEQVIKKRERKNDNSLGVEG